MNERDPITADTPARIKTPRRAGLYVAAGLGALVVLGAFANSSFSQALRHRLVGVPEAAAAAFDGRFGRPFGLDWRSGIMNAAIEAVINAHADRIIRHLAVEIDATTEQQDRLRTVVQGVVKDLLPMREKVMAARATARDLLTAQTIDRAALEKLRADQIALHDQASKRLVQAVADAADVLTADQRRTVSELLPPRGGFGGGPWNRGPWGGGFWRH